MTIGLLRSNRQVWNFGDDNSMLVLAPAFALHGWPDTMDLDQFNVSVDIILPSTLSNHDLIGDLGRPGTVHDQLPGGADA